MEISTGTYTSSSVHVGSKPDGFGVVGAGRPPGLAWDVATSRDARLACVHVAVHLDSVIQAALVWIDPVFTFGQKKNHHEHQLKGQLRLVESKPLT